MAKDMTLEDYRALARPRTGLVPMKFLKATLTDKVDDIAGYTPETAMAMHASGLAEPAEGGGKAPGSAEKKSGPVTSKVLDKPEDSDAARRGGVEIPDEWEGIHHLQRITLAEKITGKRPGTAADADNVIRAELERRG